MTLVILVFINGPSLIAIIVASIFKEVAKVYKGTTCAIASVSKTEQFGATTYYFYNVAYAANGPRLRASADSLTTKYNLGTTLPCQKKKKYF